MISNADSPLKSMECSKSSKPSATGWDLLGSRSAKRDCHNLIGWSCKQLKFSFSKKRTAMKEVHIHMMSLSLWLTIFVKCGPNQVHNSACLSRVQYLEPVQLLAYAKYWYRSRDYEPQMRPNKNWAATRCVLFSLFSRSLDMMGDNICNTPSPMIWTIRTVRNI